MSDVINSVINMGNDVINSVISHMTGSFMSIFILGIVTGWLIEWLFYYFIWKKCSPKKSAEKSQERSSNSASKAPITADETAKSTGIEIKKHPKKQQSANELTNEAVLQTLESTKDSKVTVQDDEVATPQDREVSKTSKENRLTEKNAPIKKETLLSEAPSKKVPQADDFTTIVGIGPQISKYLNDIEVDSFKKLSVLTREELIEKLSEKGVQLSNKEVMSSWAEQAKLADAGDVDGLVAFQNKLKNS